MNGPLSAGTKVGPYDIVAPLGEGGMGIVYRAADRALDRHVALKFLSGEFSSDSERVARFQREARVLALLNHPNIAAIYGFEESGPAAALVMELVEGQTLAERLASGPIPVADVLEIARQIAEALEYAHENGVIHRDLKPANIKLTSSGQIKVLDFGLAKALTPDTRSVYSSNSPTLSLGATQAGVVMGTVAYMSPEQAKGKLVDRRADIWAFGVVVLELLTGKQIFAGETAAETMAHVIMKDPAWDLLPADTPPRLRALLKRCLTREPRSRLQSMGDARVEIEQIPSDANVPEVMPAVAVPSRRGRELALAVVALVLLALAGLAIGLWREAAPARATVRFDILSSDEITLQTRLGQPISPDGRKLAFIGNDKIWIRSLDSSTPVALRGTEGAIRLFWSPDSQHLAFSTASSIQRVAAAGGDPKVLVNQGGGDFAWSSEGVLLITSDGPLLRVSDMGGQPAEETVLDASLKESRHDFPHFLPDGRHYLFLARGEQSRAVYVGTLGSKERHLLPNITTAASYSSGHLFFLRDGTVVAQPFDVDTFTLSGEAFPVTPQFAPVGALTANFSVSTDGSIAFLRSEASNATRLVWLDRHGKQLKEEAVGGSVQAPNLSFDGKLVAFERADGNGKRDIWSLDLARGTDMRLTFEGNSGRPVFSPDGRQLVFGRSPGGVATTMYRKSASGTGDEVRLVTGEPTDWSPDGRHILFIRSGDLLALSLADQKETVVATGKGNDRRGRFSRDGNWVAYESDESGQFEVYVQNFPPTGNRQQISASGGGSAWWRSDGKELFFYAPNQKLMSVDLKLVGRTLEASAPNELFQVPGVIANGRFVASLDGQQFLLPLQQPSKPFLSVILNALTASQ